MSDYWGTHTPGKDCPCKPKRGGTWTNGKVTVYWEHKSPKEPITDPAVIEEMTKVANKSLFGTENVIVEG